MQRFFSTFPGGWPGVGLLLLRSLLATTAAWQAGSYLGSAHEPVAIGWAAAILALLSGLLLLAGGLTPASSAVAGVSMLLVTMADATGTLPLNVIGAWCMAVVALAAVLLGPGALSIDAWWFGRREIVFADTPPQSHS